MTEKPGKPVRAKRPTITDQEALLFHSKGRPGKLEIIPTKPLFTQRDLNLGDPIGNYTYTIQDGNNANVGTYTTPVFDFNREINSAIRSSTASGPACDSVGIDSRTKISPAALAIAALTEVPPRSTPANTWSETHTPNN